jgi:hypothetical protein
MVGEGVETGWRASLGDEGTVRLSPKGESDRITQRSAVQIRPRNHERHCRNAVAFSFKLASALGNRGELLALARHIAHRSPQEFRLSSILRWLNRSDRYRQNYQTDEIGSGPPVLPDPATYITEERRQFEPVSFTSVATAPIATTSNFSTGACVEMTGRCPIPRARR